MSYRLIDSNALAIKYPEVDKMPCIYADLPNGLDCAYYSVNRFAELKHARWIISPDDAEGICTRCNYKIYGRLYQNTYMIVPYNYCPNCGARMDDDWEEPEINPCRGCDDYDGRGGCKSRGGCGAERNEE